MFATSDLKWWYVIVVAMEDEKKITVIRCTIVSLSIGYINNNNNNTDSNNGNDNSNNIDATINNNYNAGLFCNGLLHTIN